MTLFIIICAGLALGAYLAFRSQNKPSARRVPFLRSLTENGLLHGISIGRMLRVTPGRRHAWYESSVGLIRKPL